MSGVIEIFTSSPTLTSLILLQPQVLNSGHMPNHFNNELRTRHDTNTHQNPLHSRPSTPRANGLDTPKGLPEIIIQYIKVHGKASLS